MHPVIGIIFDFDETLGEDSISLFLKKNNIDPNLFWQEMTTLVKEGFDPPLAYMNRILNSAKQGKINASREFLTRAGQEIKLFPGLPDALRELKDSVLNNEEFKKADIKLEFYIISGGFEDMINATGIAQYVDGIFGCNFYYENRSIQPTGIKSTITFTEKTRYLHGIRKGVSVEDLRKNPYKINEALLGVAERIPYKKIIYIGDGATDIPCLSTILKNGGTGIGVTAPFGSFEKGYELARDKRITVGPYTANYENGSDLRKVLEETILKIGSEICKEV
jgi:2-hydroxy-3-keto-5-methylthiopentenyl-1-phosphate phosphatase